MAWHESAVLMIESWLNAISWFAINSFELNYWWRRYRRRHRVPPPPRWSVFTDKIIKLLPYSNSRSCLNNLLYHFYHHRQIHRVPHRTFAQCMNCVLHAFATIIVAMKNPENCIHFDCCYCLDCHCHSFSFSAYTTTVGTSLLRLFSFVDFPKKYIMYITSLYYIYVVLST